AAGQGLEDDLHHVLVDHLAQTDLLGVFGRHVDGHVVVEDLDGQVLPALTEDLPLLLLHDRACPVVRIHHFVTDVVQAASPSSSLSRQDAGARESTPAEPRHYSEDLVKVPTFQGFLREIPAQAVVRSPPSSAIRTASRSVSAGATAGLPRVGVPGGATTVASPSLPHSSSRRSA